MRSITKFGVGAFLTAGLLGCPDVGGNGKLFFADNEAALLDGPNDQKYALGDGFDFKVTVFNNNGVILDDTFTSQGNVEGIIQVDSTTFSDGGSPDLDDDSLRVQGTSLAPGNITLQILDAAGAIVDFVDFEVIAADEVLVHPMQFDGNSNKFLDSINIFEGGNVELLTRLRSNAESTDLRGQVTGTATSDDITGGVTLSFVQDVAFELGEKFIGAVNGTAQSLVSINVAEAAANTATLNFSDTAASFLNAITVTPIALDPNLVELVVNADGQDPINPVPFGAIRLSSRLTVGGQEVFGGTYSFVEVTPGAALLNISQAQSTGDFITFTAANAGEALVEVCLINTVGGAGNCVDAPEIVSVHVAP